MRQAELSLRLPLMSHTHLVFLIALNGVHQLRGRKPSSSSAEHLGPSRKKYITVGGVRNRSVYPVPGTEYSLIPIVLKSGKILNPHKSQVACPVMSWLE